ncbi:MAG: hypothetical protein PHH77_12940 [Victivallaceae bacterium]|nr:hypothetical protein [Victivallaceae bacterium]
MYKIGFEAKIFYGTAGTTASTELKHVQDSVSLNIEKGSAEVAVRSSGWKKVLSGLKDASVEFTLAGDTSDAGFLAIQNAFFNDTPIALFIADAETGGVGLDADFEVISFNRTEDLEEVINYAVSVKPSANSEREPSWEGGSSGSE